MAKKGSQEDLDGLREALQRAIVLSPERLQEAADEAVRRGRMLRTDADELVRTLLDAGRRQTDDLLADLSQLLGRPRQMAETARTKVRHPRGGGDGRGSGAGGFPIPGYDDLTAAQITSKLDGLSPAELRKVRDYEARHGNRKTVLGAVDRALR